MLEELKRLTPRNEKGQLKHKYHQRLTEDVGHPKLREHLASVIALMKAAPNWAIFERLINRALPKYNVSASLFTDDDFGPVDLGSSVPEDKYAKPKVSRKKTTTLVSTVKC